MIKLTPLEGKTWISKCDKCSTQYFEGCGSTPCCGATQSLVDGTLKKLNNMTIKEELHIMSVRDSVSMEVSASCMILEKLEKTNELLEMLLIAQQETNQRLQGNNIY